jgi:hypothetical protein
MFGATLVRKKKSIELSIVLLEWSFQNKANLRLK